MGNTCTTVADSCQCMAKPIQYCNLPPIKINKFIFKKINKIVNHINLSIYFMPPPFWHVIENRILLIEFCLAICSRVIVLSGVGARKIPSPYNQDLLINGHTDG